MPDECQILTYGSSGADEFGLPVKGYTPGTVAKCGFNPTASREVQVGADVVITDASLRLPIDTVLDSKDRVQITRRHGQVLSSPRIFEVVGEPERGPSALVARLKGAAN